MMLAKPLLTIVIPAYNGEPYLDLSFHSIFNQTILEEQIVQFFEIIIIDDGSKDNTYKLAQSLARKANSQTFSNFVRVFTKPNGQYGSVINFSLTKAHGTYFKILDVDDSLSTFSLIDIIHVLQSFEEPIDVVYTNYTFEKVGTNHQIEQSLRDVWNPYKVYQVRNAKFPSDIITMHSIIYRTELLTLNGYCQIERVYYSDSQYALIPLLYAKTFYYANFVLYRYYIGRQEQSINLKVMVHKRHDQYRVLMAILKQLDIDQIQSPELLQYFIVVLCRLAQWQVVLIVFDKNVKNKRKEVKKFMREIKENFPKGYNFIWNNILFLTIRCLNGHFILPIVKFGIRIYAKFKKNILAEWD